MKKNAAGVSVRLNVAVGYFFLYLSGNKKSLESFVSYPDFRRTVRCTAKIFFELSTLFKIGNIMGLFFAAWYLCKVLVYLCCCVLSCNPLLAMIWINTSNRQ